MFEKREFFSVRQESKLAVLSEKLQYRLYNRGAVTLILFYGSLFLERCFRILYSNEVGTRYSVTQVARDPTTKSKHYVFCPRLDSVQWTQLHC